MRERNSIAAAMLLCGALALASTARAGDDTFSMKEILNEAGGVFGGVSEAIAKVIESAFKAHGEPTGFIKGSDRGAAVAVGYRQGEGTLTLKNRGSHKVYWRSPSGSTGSSPAWRATPTSLAARVSPTTSGATSYSPRCARGSDGVSAETSVC